MKSKIIISLLAISLFSCQETNKNNLNMSNKPTPTPISSISIIPSPILSIKPPTPVAPYLINNETKKIFTKLEDKLQSQIFSAKIDEKGNISLISEYGTIYHVSLPNILDENSLGEGKSILGNYISSLELDSDGNGYIIYNIREQIVLTGRPIGILLGSEKSYESYYSDLTLMKINNFKIDNTNKYKLNFPSYNSYYTDLNLGKGYYLFLDQGVSFDDLQFLVNKPKIDLSKSKVVARVDEIYNFTESRLVKEINALDDKNNLSAYILDDKKRNAIILTKNIDSGEYGFLKLKDDKLESLGVYKGIKFWYDNIFGKIDSAGNGYIYWYSASNEISFLKLANYSFDINNIKRFSGDEIRLSLDSIGDGYMYWYSSSNEIYLINVVNYNFDVNNIKKIIGEKIRLSQLDKNGNGFSLYDLTYTKINNYIPESKKTVFSDSVLNTSDSRIKNINVSVNKFGDGIITWNERAELPIPNSLLFEYKTHIKILKHYDVL